MKKLIIGLSLLALTACDDSFSTPPNLGKETAIVQSDTATPVDEIQIISGATVNGSNFEVLGPLEASVGKATVFHPSPTVQDAEQKLKIEAAKLRADAVINAKISNVTICPLSWGCRIATGTAVKFSN